MENTIPNSGIYRNYSSGNLTGQFQMNDTTVLVDILSEFFSCYDYGGCVFDYILNELRSATLPLFWNSNIDSDFLNGMPCILFIHWYDTGAANHLKFLTWSRKVQNLISQWKFFFYSIQGCSKLLIVSRVLVSIEWNAGSMHWKSIKQVVWNVSRSPVDTKNWPAIPIKKSPV